MRRILSATLAAAMMCTSSAAPEREYASPIPYACGQRVLPADEGFNLSPGDFTKALAEMRESGYTTVSLKEYLGARDR